MAIVGPTGTGKSSLAVFLAQRFKGEIINADSRQIYRGMDIGTAKPSAEERSLVLHHLFDLICPDKSFSLAEYLLLAKGVIKDIHQREKLPFLVGGSGQYVRALLEGWQIPRIAPNPELRKELEQIAAEQGAQPLYTQLQKIDPAAADKIDQRNIRRVIRALEIAKQAGDPFSRDKTKKVPNYNVLIVGLTTTRSELYHRVDMRVDSMIQKGLVGEVQNLVKGGFDFDLASMNSIGYKQTGRLLRGEINLEETASLIKFETHRFIRHQYAWFKLSDPKIQWFDIQSEIQFEIMVLLSNYLNRVY